MAYSLTSRRFRHPITTITIAVLLIVILEGAVRKWLWPGSTLPLLVLRDSLVLTGIAIGIRNGWYRLSAWPEAMLAIWTLAISCLIFFQTMTDLEPPAVAVLGIRSWLLYAWFALLCARTQNAEQMERILRLLGYLLIPMAALVFAQHWLPPGHFLNRQADSDEAGHVFTVADGIVRVTGTFSFNAGYGVFISFAGITALALLAGELRSIRKQALRWTIIASYFVCVILSGSRGSIISSGVMIAALLVAMLIRNKRGSIRNSVAVLCVLCIMGALAPLLFSRAISATQTRFQNAAHSESMSARISNSLFGSDDSREQFTVLGHGVGLGNNAAGVLMGGKAGFILGEGEPDKILLEAGLFGFIFLLIRWMMAFWGLYRSFALIKRDGIVWPFLLWLFAAESLLLSQMTSQLTAHGFEWIAVGLAVASLMQPAVVRQARRFAIHRGMRLQNEP
jgi:hypothetical protein